MKIKCILDQVKEDWKSIGIKQGIEQGIEQGTIQTKKSMIVRVLQHVGILLPKRVMNRINGIYDVTVLDFLFKSALNAKSLDQFVKDLP